MSLVLIYYIYRIWRSKRRKEAVVWELEDQLKELDEKLSLGHITQEEYEQKKKLLEKSEAYNLKKCVKCGKEIPMVAIKCVHSESEQPKRS